MSSPSLALSLVLAVLGLAPGEPAPDFSAANQDGKPVRLSSFKGKPVLVFFYPKDDTPGCTKEACGLRNVYAQFQKRGAVVLGVSRQDAKSHQAFREKHSLPFDLLVDADGKVAEAFGVSMMPVMGLHRRQSVLVGPDGKVFRLYRDVDPEKHADEVLKDLDLLAAAAPK
jgi:thioredoxin-dependent peroxiredoxin